MKTARLERLPSYLSSQVQTLEVPAVRSGLQRDARSAEIERVKDRIADLRRSMDAWMTRHVPKIVPAWYDQGQERIDYISSLPKDWDSYGAERPNDASVQMAREVLRHLKHVDLAPSGIVPSAENGIGFVFRRGDKYADVEIFNTGKIYYLLDDDLEAPHAHEVSFSSDGILEAVKAIRTFLD